MFRDTPSLGLRCNVWRSLFVLDRFLAASLGRPTAIPEISCSEVALQPPSEPGPDAHLVKDYKAHSQGLDATVQSCRVIGIILRKIYATRKVSVKVAQDIIRQCTEWLQQLHPTLRWRADLASDTTFSPAHGIAILHVNLIYCHSVVLLTRPFFLLLVQSDQGGSDRKTPRPGSRMEKLSEICVSASYHTLAVVWVAYEAKYLPRRNPFVM